MDQPQEHHVELTDAPSLFLAISSGKPEYLESLLDGGIKFLDNEIKAVLFLIASDPTLKNGPQFIDVLVKKANANLTVVNDQTDKLTLFDVALSHKNTAMAKLLMTRGAIVSEENQAQLKKLVDAESITEQDKQKIEEYISANQPDKLKELLERGAHVFLRGQFGIQLLCKQVRNAESTEIAEILIDHGADIHGIDEKGKLTALMNAADRKQQNEKTLLFIKLLVEKGARVNDCSRRWKATALHFACRQNNYAAAVFLIEKGANVNAVGGIDKTTPLHIVAGHQNIELTQYLLAKGAKLYVKDGDEELPIHVARGKVKEVLRAAARNLSPIEHALYWADVGDVRNALLKALENAVVNDGLGISQTVLEDCLDFIEKESSRFINLEKYFNTKNNNTQRSLLDYVKDIIPDLDFSRFPKIQKADKKFAVIMEELPSPINSDSDDVDAAPAAVSQERAKREKYLGK